MKRSASKGPRVLLLAPDVPRPYGGGGMRAYHFARALAGVAEVDLVVLLEEEAVPIPEDLRRGCARILQLPAGFSREQAADVRHSNLAGLGRAVRVSLLPWRERGSALVKAAAARAEELAKGLDSWPRRLHAALLQAEADLGIRFFGLVPQRTVERYDEFKRLRPEIDRAMRDHPPDVIWFEHSTMFPYAARLHACVPSARLVCNAHNVEWSLHERLSEIASAPSLRRWLRTQAEACRRLEQNAFAAAELTFCCSEADAALARRLAPKARAVPIANGVDTSYFRRMQDRSGAPALLFTGGMGYEPNRDAVRYFLGEIWPLIRREVPECRFCIAGSGAQHCAPLAAADSSIDIASDVPDMRPYFEMATLVVVPLRAGSGTRTKIFEAMAMERAVVSTTLGAEGIDLTPERHLCLADEPATFARQVVELLRDVPRRRALEQAGRQLVCQSYDWNQLTAEAVRIFRERVMQGVSANASPS